MNTLVDSCCDFDPQIYKFWVKMTRIYIQTSFVKHVLSLDHFEFTSLNYSKIIKIFGNLAYRILPFLTRHIKGTRKGVKYEIQRHIETEVQA